MLAAEVFVPGMILGSLGGICLAVAIGTAYASYGPLVGTLTFAGIGMLTLVGFVAWMFVFPHTPIGRRIMLQTDVSVGDGIVEVRLLGLDGSALTPLRPSGTAVIEGRKVDVVSESDFISAGEAVVVVREEGQRVVVRKKV